MRKQLESRPLLTLALALIIGLASGLSALNLVLAPILFWFGTSSWPFRGLLAAAVVSGLVLWGADPPAETRRGFYDGAADVVEQPDRLKDGDLVTLRTSDGRLVQAVVRPSGLVALGDRIRVQAILQPLTETRAWLRQRGISGALRLVQAPHIIRRGFPLWHFGAAARERFLTFTERHFGVRARSILNAVCFNATGWLDDDSKDRLRRSGTIHIVSTSGLHVVLLAGAMFSLFSLPGLPRAFTLGLVWIFTALYVAASGMEPPAVRAFIISVVIGSAYLFRREPDGLSALGFAALLTLLVWPRELSTPGFQLSFMTFMGLVLYGRWEAPSEPSAWRRMEVRARQIFWASLVASAFSAPLVAYHFGEVSWIAPVSNVLIAGVLGPLVGSALVAWLVSGFVPGLAGALAAWIATPLAGWVLLVTGSLGAPRWVVVAVPEFSAWWLIPVYGLMIAAWRPRVRPA